MTIGEAEGIVDIVTFEFWLDGGFTGADVALKEADICGMVIVVGFV